MHFVCVKVKSALHDTPELSAFTMAGSALRIMDHCTHVRNLY
jgi:hypothetical protein